MTILEAIRGKPGAKTLAAQAPEVLRKLRAAEAELAELETQHGAAALDAIADEAGASDRLATLNRNLTNARDNVATLKAAHTAAVERDEMTLNVQRTAIRKTQMAAVRKHLEARDVAAAALTEAIAEATKQYHALLDRSAKAQAACPIGTKWPFDTVCEIDPIRRLVTDEIFRASATAGNRDGRAFPGAQLSNAKYEWQPRAIPSLVETVRQSSEYAMRQLIGKAPE
jgi:hypothetical protein